MYHVHVRFELLIACVMCYVLCGRKEVEFSKIVWYAETELDTYDYPVITQFPHIEAPLAQPRVAKLVR